MSVSTSPTPLPAGLAGKPSGGLLGFLKRKRRAVAGQEGRNACCLVGVLVLVDKNLPIDGLVTELGASSLLFRPATTYILDRTNAEVSVRFGEQDVRGQIIGVTAAGYNVALAARLPQAVITEALSPVRPGMDDARPASD